MTRWVPRDHLPVDATAFPNTGPVRHGVGIDLGTTNSVVAVASFDPSDGETIRVRCLEVEQPTAEAGTHVGTLVPSVVARHGDRTFVGEGAKRLLAKGPALGLVEYRDLFFGTKNEIGTDRVYAKAPEGYRTPAEIGGWILRYLRRAVDVEPDAMVVTVPASFQVAQRAETRRAIEIAGFDGGATQLLDEPVAAFIDFLIAHENAISHWQKATKKVLVFDFGGGTCDIAILTIEKSGGRLRLMPRSISRFHRLGGGDIDAAIVYDVLIPQLVEQNRPSRRFGYREKRFQLEPVLRPLAESLKIGLCRELDRRLALGHSEPFDIVRKLPGRYTVSVDGVDYLLSNPVLTRADFDKVLQPFLDRNILAPRSDEYRMARSIFAPLEDALLRARLAYEDVDFVLLVGGSADIPQVRTALARAFPTAEIGTYAEPADRKECVARGAALAALVAACTGERVVWPVSFDAIGIQTRDGFEELVPAGSVLPFPVSGEQRRKLGAPRSSPREPLPLRLEIRSGDGRCLFTTTWELEPPVREHEEITLDFRFDADQVFHLRATRLERPDQGHLVERVESPLTHVVNPVTQELEAERLERQIADRLLPPAEREAKALELVRLLEELGRREKAFDILRAVQAQRGRPDSQLLNWMALLLWRMGDLEEAARLFEESAEADKSYGAPLFNLSLLLEKQSKKLEAFDAIDRALQREISGPYLTQRALLAGELDDKAARQRALEEARRCWSSLDTMNDWELSWYRRWGQEIRDDAALRAADRERRRRTEQGEPRASDLAELPVDLDRLG